MARAEVSPPSVPRLKMVAGAPTAVAMHIADPKIHATTTATYFMLIFTLRIPSHQRSAHWGCSEKSLIPCARGSSKKRKHAMGRSLNRFDDNRRSIAQYFRR